MSDKYSKRYICRRRVVKLFVAFGLVVLVMVLGQTSVSNEPPGPDVIPLDDSNFDAVVLNRSGKDRLPWLVEFYANWCPHCRNFTNDFIEIGKRLKGKAHVASVDVVANKALSSRFGVNSLPHFKIFKPGSSVVTYGGPRTVDAMVSKLLAMAGQ